MPTSNFRNGPIVDLESLLLISNSTTTGPSRTQPQWYISIPNDYLENYLIDFLTGITQILKKKWQSNIWRIKRK
jgi:hypothetical protein